MLIGFDPGRDKCGVAIMAPSSVKPSQGEVLLHEVVASAQAIDRLRQLIQTYAPIARLILGDQTASKFWRAQLSAAFPGLPIVTVDERHSSLEARDRYWQMYPSTGWMRLLPQGLKQPPRPIDDIVAILLIERYLQKSP
jgi:RNase H-fold protein (predicted Holliday junction resolvase)